ncbi:hypothetical protein Hanom_Chr14g01276401 [Helianthus anomalus]
MTNLTGYVVQLILTRTQAPTATNYDVGSTTWANLRVAPLQSAMEVTNLGRLFLQPHICFCFLRYI